jgi:methionine-rich copper-binding protein CopC
MSQIKVLGAIAVLAWGLMATSAAAHPKLRSVVPAADMDANASNENGGATKEKAGGAPKEIRLTFSEAVIAQLSGIVPRGRASSVAKGRTQERSSILGDACRMTCVAHLIDHASQMGAELFGNLDHYDMSDRLH